LTTTTSEGCPDSSAAIMWRLRNLGTAWRTLSTVSLSKYFGKARTWLRLLLGKRSLTSAAIVCDGGTRNFELT
jgi:hypothetical protein